VSVLFNTRLKYRFTNLNYRCTVPGGYVELSEHGGELYCDDCSMKPDNGAKILINNFRKAPTKMGRPPPDIEPWKGMLEKAGFEDVKAVQVKEPIGPWPKDPSQKRIGAMTLLNDETYAESHCMAPFTRVLGMEVKEGREVIDASHRAVRNKNNHIYGI
jgi:hypothetical protein